MGGRLVAVFFAVDAEGKSLEDIADPLGVIAKPAEAIFVPATTARCHPRGD